MRATTNNLCQNAITWFSGRKQFIEEVTTSILEKINIQVTKDSTTGVLNRKPIKKWSLTLIPDIVSLNKT